MFQLPDSKYFNSMNCLMANIAVALTNLALRSTATNPAIQVGVAFVRSPLQLFSGSRQAGSQPTLDSSRGKQKLGWTGQFGYELSFRLPQFFLKFYYTKRRFPVTSKYR
jgi:hypothetical protein